MNNKMDKVILPFELNTYVNQYLDQSFGYGIIQANAKENNIDIMPWVAAKFINYSFNLARDINKFSVQIFDTNGLNDGKLKQDIIELDKNEYLTNNAKPLLKFITDAIKTGHYILGQFNEKYVTQMSCYQVKDFNHTYVLYGYDNSSLTFKSAGYVKGYKYQEYDLSFYDYYNAIKYNDEDHISLRIMKFNPDQPYILNFNRLVQVFQDYYLSENHISANSPVDQVYGLEAMNYLAEYYLNLKDKHQFDIRYSIGVVKSKAFLVDVLKYLEDYLQLQELEGILKSAKEVASKAALVHLLGIKYNYTFDHNILEHIHSHIMSIIEIEKITFPQIISKLKAITILPTGTYTGPLDRI